MPGVCRRFQCVTVAGLLVLAASSSEAQPAVQHVLLLQSFDRGNMADDYLTGNFRVELGQRIGHPVNVVQIVVGPTGFVGAPEQATVDYIRSAFADRPKPDLIVTLAGPAAAFARKYRAQLFPEVPLLFASVNQQYLSDAPLGDNETAVAVVSDFPGVIDQILQLLPETKQVFVVLGSGQSGTFWGRELQMKFTRFQNRLTFIWSGGLSLAEILRQCASLPRDSAILYLNLGTDGRGGAYADARVLADLHAAANAPIFGLHSVMLGTGIVGGKLVDIDEVTRNTADSAIRILAGATPRSVTVPPQVPGNPVFDSRELQRWDIPESRLPTGSVVRYRSPTLWREYRFPVLSAVGALAIQSLLIIGLLYQRSARRTAEIENRRSEAELRESEARLLLAAESAHLGIWVRDFSRNDIWATDSWRVLFGFAKSEPLDLNHFLDRLHPDDREMVQRTLATAVEGDGRYEVEYRVVLPGGIRWITSRGRVQFGGAGTPILERGVSLDVTERRKTEREAQLLRQEVAHVGRVSMMGQLASALAHEINQPLGAILRNAEAAELFMQSASPDLDEVRAILADIVKNDQRAGGVIDRMRALLKRHELEVIRLDVGAVIADVVTLTRADAVSRHVKLEVDIADALQPVQGDRVHLQQVLLNLVLNGMDAVNGANQGDRRVTVTARPGGPRVVEVAVRDTGPGIPAEILATVFDPFFSTKPNGMGMGLAISRTIVEAHGGQLWAENNHGGGATLRFTLPIAEEAAAK